MLRESFCVHVSGFCLEGMEAVKTCIDEALDYPEDRTAAMEDDLIAAAMCLVDEFLEVGKDELIFSFELFLPQP